MQLITTSFVNNLNYLPKIKDWEASRSWKGYGWAGI